MSPEVPRIVKPPRKITVVIAVFIIIVCTAHFDRVDATLSEKVDRYYMGEIHSVKEKLTKFSSLCDERSSLKTLQQQFVLCRLAYKKLAVLSEYFNGYDTKFLNGPALGRSEDGTPDIIIPPQGFQAIEEIIFGDPTPGFTTDVSKLLEKMVGTLKRMENEPGRIYKFREELVWDALRSATIRLMAMGITGFDSPVSQNSLPEAGASIDGIKNILRLFTSRIDERSPGASDQLIRLLNNAVVYLQKYNNFNAFDRLTFISAHINPFYKRLVQTRLNAGILIPDGRSPVNFNAQSIFQEDFFDINFFSPGKEYWRTNKRIALGKKLFSDPVLSGNNDRSCASCHMPQKAFTDGVPVPYALDNKTLLSRNTPTLWNSTLQTRQFYDTRTDMLENQLKEVVHNTDEMKGSLKESVTDLKKSAEYVHLFNAAYEEEKEPVNTFNTANAISSYIRSLISLNSRFDQYMLGQRSKLNNSEKNGFNLFTGKAKCATCHFIPLFNGLVPPEFTDTETEVLGVPAKRSKKHPTLDNDLGKYNITNSLIHKYAFKTSTLRNIELTGPYMHNGVFNTLEEVMDFYNEGGGEGLKIAPDNQTLPKERLKLTKKEISDIIAFMKTLTDTTTRYR
jgi:cytochrome c peroxidase